MSHTDILSYYQPLVEQLKDTPLERWSNQFNEIFERQFNPKRWGDIPKWLNALDALPDITPSAIELASSQVGFSAVGLDTDKLHETLMQLHPWRKGPFNYGGIHIDTEWRSDFKWDRLLPHIEPLKDRTILDVGCGSGYHCWRMAGEGAKLAIGIDPSPLFVVQFLALQRTLQQKSAWVIPSGIEHLPEKLRTFDTVFSMGVLYHRKSPIDHLMELREALKPGGQLVLETLVINGDKNDVLVPPGRYAQMGNVWFLPSTEHLKVWLEKTKFSNIKVVDLNETSTEEQRSTDWMRFHSLKNYLDPDNPKLTVEGHPRPLRAVITATAP